MHFQSSISAAGIASTNWVRFDTRAKVWGTLQVGSCGQPLPGFWPYYPTTGFQPTMPHLVTVELFPYQSRSVSSQPTQMRLATSEVDGCGQQQPTSPTHAQTWRRITTPQSRWMHSSAAKEWQNQHCEMNWKAKSVNLPHLTTLVRLVSMPSWPGLWAFSLPALLSLITSLFWFHSLLCFAVIDAFAVLAEDQENIIDCFQKFYCFVFI